MAGEKMPCYTPSEDNGSREWGSVIFREGVKILVSNTQMDRRESRTLELKSCKSQASNSYVNYRILIKM